MTQRNIILSKEEEGGSWFVRLKQFLQGEPQDQEELVDLLRDAQIRSLINSETLAMIEGAILFLKCVLETLCYRRIKWLLSIKMIN